jgi:hypothetical protein
LAGLPESPSLLAESNSDNNRLLFEEKREIMSHYNSIKDKEKWKLSSGLIVENAMAELASKCLTEHLAHSMILNPWNLIWQEYFSKSDLNEIMNYRRVSLPNVPDFLMTLFARFRGVRRDEEIIEIISKVEWKLYTGKDSHLKWMMDGLQKLFKQKMMCQWDETILLEETW